MRRCTRTAFFSALVTVLVVLACGPSEAFGAGAFAERFERGVNVLVYGNDPDTRRKSARLFARLRRANVNHVAIVVPFFQDGPHGVDLHVKPDRTPSSRTLLSLVRGARTRGFTVTVSPLLDEDSLAASGGW